METSATHEIAEYVSDLNYGGLPEAAVAEAKWAILDTVGVMLAAVPSEVGRIVTGYAGRTAGLGTSVVVGMKATTSPEQAALANGTLAHALDFDDRGHASTHVLGAALALGDFKQLSGRDLLLSYIAGREVRMHLNEYFDTGRFEGRGPGQHGWHATGVLGALASAAAASKALGLRTHEGAMALGMTVSLASGVIANFGTMTKPLHAGNAARSGVLAAQLAEAGFTSDDNAMTARMGFQDAFCADGGDWDAREVARTLRDHFHIVKNGVRIKPYPTCSGSHPFIETTRYIVDQYGIKAEDVQSLECTRRASLNRPYATNWIEGKFSAAFCIAATLIDGAVTLQNCTDEFVQSSQVQDLFKRITYVDDSEPMIRVRTHSGREITEPLRKVRNLDSPAERTEKFYGCAVPVVGEARAREIEKVVMGLEDAPSVSSLTALLAAA